ncbi:DUF1700 domain-containing protein [Lachnospiraceae bacterium ZAX-1]
MNREEFMAQLEKLLQDIPQEERIEALVYYGGYFEDAGKGNEEKIIRELESPQKVAQTIKADMGIEQPNGQRFTGQEFKKDTKEYTENGYQDQSFADKQELGKHKSKTGTGTKQDSHDKPDQDRTAKIILLVAVAILTSPIWLGIGATLLGVAVSVLGVVVCILAAVLIVVFAFYVCGIVFICVGIGQLIAGAIAIGLSVAGTGLVCLAFALLGTVVCVWLFGKFLPWFIKGVISLCGIPFQGRRGKMA